MGAFGGGGGGGGGGGARGTDHPLPKSQKVSQYD